MKKLYLVTYDLRKSGRDYQSLYSRLNDWHAVRLLESVWLISWHNTMAVQIRDDLMRRMDSNDGLFVATLTGEAAWTRCDAPDSSILAAFGVRQPST